MASYTLTVPFTSLFPYGPNNPGLLYKVTMVCNPSGGGGTTLNKAVISFVSGSIIRGAAGVLSFPNPTDTATPAITGSSNSAVSFAFNLQLDSPPDDLDAVIVTFRLVLTIGTPSLKQSTFQIVPMATVMIPPGSTSGFFQTGIGCEGDTKVMQETSPSVQQGSWAYPPGTDFSATVSSFSSSAFLPAREEHGLVRVESSITSKLLVGVTGTTASMPPASAGSAPVLISILF